MADIEQLGKEIASLAAHLDAATHRLLQCIRLFDKACGWHEQGVVSCAHWLAWRLGLDMATAREKVRVARALGKLPAIDGALCQARLSYAKVRALTRVATPENEARLLEMALEATGAQLERLCRGYRSAVAEGGEPAPEERCVRQRILPGGMVKLELLLSSDEADLILRAIHRAPEAASVAAPEAASVAAPEAASVAAPEAHAEPLTPPEDASAETSWPGNRRVERAEIASRSSSIWIRMFSDRTPPWPPRCRTARIFPRKHYGGLHAIAGSWPRGPRFPPRPGPTAAGFPSGAVPARSRQPSAAL